MSNSIFGGARRRPLSDIGNTLQSVPNLALKETVPTCTKPFLPATASVPILAATGGSSSVHQILPNPQSPHFDDRNRDPQSVSVYAAEIISNLAKREVDLTASSYMARQNAISERMRSILVDWMVDVHSKYALHTETLYLSVNLVDRFLEKRVVQRDNLQLVGLVAMLLASKYEEIYPPEISRFIHISANTYTREQVLSWEKQMLQALDFHLTVPTVWPFLKRGLQVISAEASTENTARYFAEVCLTDYGVMQNRPTHIAAACIYLANKFEGVEPWDSNLEYYLKLRKEEILPCVDTVLAALKTAYSNQKTQAVKRKFSGKNYGAIGKTIRLEELNEL